MLTLDQAIKKYFPDEIFQNQYNVQLQDTWESKMGKLPVSYSKYFYIKPLEMVETNKRYYFDRRRPFLFSAQIASTVAPIILTTLLFCYLFFISQTPFKYSLSISLSLFILWSLVLYLNIKINQNLTNILLIDKTWIKNINTQDKETILTGEIPQGGNYSFVYNLSPEYQNKLGFLDKFFGGVFFKK